MDDTIDLLQIKIEKAKAQLSEDTLNAIAAVPWQAVVLQMRETKGYSFEQLGNLEMETELLLCGLLSPNNYPGELENRMRITKAQAGELVNEMNEKVFAKIKEELIKNTERKNIFTKKTSDSAQEFSKHGVEIIPEKVAGVPPLKEGASLPTQAGGGNREDHHLASGIPPQKGGEETLPVPEKLELESGGEVHPMLAQKLSATVQVETVKTEHTPENITKTNPPTSYPKNADPYRLPPE